MVFYMCSFEAEVDHPGSSTCDFGEQSGELRPILGGVIHKLWITMWITLLIACKVAFYF